MSFQIQPATRQGINPLICPYAESGNGKTYSGLLLARGLAGPTGKIVVADSESRRASLYADVIPGGFETFDLAAPFTPARYCEAIDAIEASGAVVGLIDSGSHEWEGAGGVLDMAGQNEQASGKAGLHNWRVPKLEHAKFVQRLLRAKIPLILCLRAKFKTKQAKDERGKTVIVKDDFVSPIQAEDFIFESTVHFFLKPDHSIVITKASHPDLRKCFPTEGPITIEHGKLLAQWCANPGGSKVANPPAKPSADPKKELLNQLRDATTEIHGWTKALGVAGWQYGKPKLQTWLTDECGFDTLIDAMTVEELKQALVKAEDKLAQGITP